MALVDEGEQRQLLTQFAGYRQAITFECRHVHTKGLTQVDQTLSVVKVRVSRVTALRGRGACGSQLMGGARQ